MNKRDIVQHDLAQREYTAREISAMLQQTTPPPAPSQTMKPVNNGPTLMQFENWLTDLVQKSINAPGVRQVADVQMCQSLGDWLIIWAREWRERTREQGVLK